jgi:hypothetical protein
MLMHFYMVIGACLIEDMYSFPLSFRSRHIHRHKRERILVKNTYIISLLFFEIIKKKKILRQCYFVSNYHFSQIIIIISFVL